jgi:hypothetical protein
VPQPEPQTLTRPAPPEEDYWAGDEAQLEPVETPDEERPGARRLPERIRSTLSERCGLCGHTRLWHHLHLMPWGRD